ncbi:MAG TPA: hypothetical protein DEF16_00080 [Gemmobacter sp.]|nr:hypothetical protein [Gemmobacter sp.]
MRVLLRALAGFLLGGLLALGIGVALPYLMPISQAEGAYAMGVVFFWMPAAAILGAVAGIVWGVLG